MSLDSIAFRRISRSSVELLVICPLCELVVDPAVGKLDLNKGQNKDEQEENPRQRRSIAHLEVAKGIVIEMEHVEPGGVVRPASGGNVGDGKDAKAANDAQDQVEENHGRNHGQGDVEEALNDVCTVNHARFMQLSGDAL
jgi:hypothetical protein